MSQLVVIDPGHGGARPDGSPGLDHGASCKGAVESDLALQHASELGAALARIGVATAFTRQGVAPALTLAGRASFANDRGAAAFVSVHCNAGHASAQGFQVFHAKGSKRGELLARMILAPSLLACSHEVASLGARMSHGVFADQTMHCGNRRLAVLRQTRMPAVLLELDFLTHRDGRARLQDDGFRRRVAAAVADGIQTWLTTA